MTRLVWADREFNSYSNQRCLQPCWAEKHYGMSNTLTLEVIKLPWILVLSAKTMNLSLQWAHVSETWMKNVIILFIKAFVVYSFCLQFTALCSRCNWCKKILTIEAYPHHDKVTYCCFMLSFSSLSHFMRQRHSKQFPWCLLLSFSFSPGQAEV